MKTYPVSGSNGRRFSIFQIETVLISPRTIVCLLSEVEGVEQIELRKRFSKFKDIHVKFKYMNLPYIVWEPFGDNSRYWIGPADMVEEGETVEAPQDGVDMSKLERAFMTYEPPFYRMVIGGILRWFG